MDLRGGRGGEGPQIRSVAPDRMLCGNAFSAALLAAA